MNYKIPIWVIATLISLISLSISSAYAKIIEDPDRPGFVKDSYIITFKPPGQGKQPIVLPPKPAQSRGKVPFMQHSSGQSKAALAAQLALNGEIVYILESMNAIHVYMPMEEAERFRHDNRVLDVHQGRLITSAEAASSWALDRMDNDGPYLNGTYNPSSNIGAGRTIWVLDTGIAYNDEYVRSAFEGSNGSRLFILDVTDSFVDPLPPHPTDPNIAPNSADNYAQLEPTGFGLPSLGALGREHGTKVAVVAAGKYQGLSYGVATGATVISVKIADTAPSGGNLSTAVFSDSNTEIGAFNWFGDYGTPGHIVNWSRGVFDGSLVGDGSTDCGGFSLPTTGGNIIDPLLESAMIKAHNNGIIIVVAAHNDGCADNNVLDPNDSHTPTRL